VVSALKSRRIQCVSFLTLASNPERCLKLMDVLHRNVSIIAWSWFLVGGGGGVAGLAACAELELKFSVSSVVGLSSWIVPGRSV
jgi:hypothetical protein